MASIKFLYKKRSEPFRFSREFLTHFTQKFPGASLSSNLEDIRYHTGVIQTIEESKEVTGLGICTITYLTEALKPYMTRPYLEIYSTNGIERVFLDTPQILFHMTACKSFQTLDDLYRTHAALKQISLHLS